MNINSIKLAMQNALLGNITPNVRAVCIKVENKFIQIIIFYHNPFTDEELGLSHRINSEFSKEIPYTKYQNSSELVILPYPEKIPQNNICLYKRHEKSK